MAGSINTTAYPLSSSCEATEVIVTDTLPISPERRVDKLTVQPIAPLISLAIREVFQDGSATSLFNGHV